MNSLVSICIPTYNAYKYIEETVECFLNQTYKKIEIIIQDDCSTDGTWELLQNLYSCNEKVHIYRNEKNLGIGPNWNAAYEKTQGEYIVIANADDIFFENFISDGLENLKSYKTDFVSFKYQTYSEKDKTKDYTSKNALLKSGIIEKPFEIIFFNNPYHIIFTIFKKTLLDRIKIGNNLFTNTQVCDFELMMRYAYHYKLYYNENIIGYYRIHDANNSSKPLAETKSFYYDVLPLWHETLKTEYYKAYKSFLIKNIFNYIKSTIRSKSPIDIKLINYQFRYYLK